MSSITSYHLKRTLHFREGCRIILTSSVSRSPSSQLEVLISSEKTQAAIQVAIAAAKRFSKSVEMWTLSLQTLVRLESEEAGPLFQEAMKLVNPKVPDLFFSTKKPKTVSNKTVPLIKPMVHFASMSSEVTFNSVIPPIENEYEAEVTSFWAKH